MLVMKFWSLSYSAFPLAAFLLADICSMIITSKLLHHSITSGHVTFTGNSHQNHAGSVTYRSQRQAALTIALAHPSADPSGTSDLKMFCPKHKRLQKPGVNIVMPMAEPSSVLSVSQKLISAALLAL